MSPRIAIVGEYYYEAESVERIPFAGARGWLLRSILGDAGIEPIDTYQCCVFPVRPQPTAKFENLCGAKKDIRHSLPPVGNGKYILDKYLPHLDDLKDQLSGLRPNLVVSMGPLASWALLGSSKFRTMRGTTMPESLTGLGLKTIPTYHPSTILADYSLRAIVTADLIKAKRESESSAITRPSRQLWIDPTISDIERFYHEHIKPSAWNSVDIETAAEQITCIGFAPRPDIALVVPFVDDRRAGNSYWPSDFYEQQAWNLVRQILCDERRKVFQNGLYDVQFLWRKYGIKVRNWTDDTMLMHHAMHPEMQKGLAFLGSIYTNEPAWKLMRDKHIQTIKKGDME